MRAGAGGGKIDLDLERGPGFRIEPEAARRDARQNGWRRCGYDHRGSQPENTLRYYERIGLIPPVPRSKSGIRDYDEESCGWIEMMKCMRKAGVQIEALIEYVTLFRQGDDTADARKAILVEQRDQLVDRMADMQASLDRLNQKIENYEHILEAERRLRKPEAV